VPGYGQVPYVDVAGTINADDGALAIFVLNRDLSRSHRLELNWEGQTATRLMSCFVLTGTDLKAVNGFDKPENVVPQAADKPIMDGNVTKLELPPRSYSLYQWGA
jgi:alpha-N-arabinofuranosidase